MFDLKKTHHLIFAGLLALILGVVGRSTTFAQGEEETPLPPTEQPIIPTAVPQIGSVDYFEPNLIVSDRSNVLTVRGRNFSPDSVVRVAGYGVVTTGYVNSETLSATLPENIVPGVYNLTVINSAGESPLSQGRLTVLFPASPTVAPPEPPPPPTAVPGAPNLVARDYSIEPNLVTPDNPFTLTFNILNQGNYSALGVSVAVDTSSKFMPAGGQASVIVSDIIPNGTARVTMPLIAPSDASGVMSVPVDISYRDQNGNTHTAKAMFSVTVADVVNLPQLSLSRYMVMPGFASAGDAVVVQLLLTNHGTGTAHQILMRLGDGVLLAGGQGDSISFGDLGAGESRAMSIPLIISGGAEAGPQRQNFTITYLDGGESKQVDSSITVQVEASIKPEPFLLLQSYTIEQEGETPDHLKPSERFTLRATLQNMGQTVAENVYISFTGGGSEGGGSSGTSAFTPVGIGGTMFFSKMGGNGEQIEIEQDFMVNSSATSGVHAIQMTVSYRKPDGETATTTFTPSVLIVRPARLNLALVGSLPPEIPHGEPLSFSLTVTNTEERTIEVRRIEVLTDDAEILDGGSSSPGAIAKDKNSRLDVMLLPNEEGEFEFSVKVDYVDELGGTQSVINSYSVMVSPPLEPWIPDEDFEPPFPPDPEPEPEETTGLGDDWLGRFIMGFLGLGS